MKVIRHFPDTIAKVVHGMMSEWKVLPLIVKIDRKHRGAGKGPWVPVGGIEISCNYFLYWVKVHKSSVSEKIKQYERDLMFQETRIFILLK